MSEKSGKLACLHTVLACHTRLHGSHIKSRKEMHSAWGIGMQIFFEVVKMRGKIQIGT